MSYVLFADRKKIENDYKRWCYLNNIRECTSTLLAFLTDRNLLKDRCETAYFNKPIHVTYNLDGKRPDNIPPDMWERLKEVFDKLYDENKFDISE